MALPKVPIQKRGLTPAEVGQKELDDFDVGTLGSRFRSAMFDELGIELGPQYKVPKTRDGVPRFFVMAKDSSGRAAPRSFDEAGLKVNTPEFWKQVQLGNVFAFPVGQAKPVQLQVVRDKEGYSHLAVTEPIAPENLPKPPGKRLNFLQRALRFLSGGLAYRNRARQDRQAEAEHKHIVSAVKKLVETRQKSVAQEPQELENRKKELVREKKQKALDSDREAAKRDLSSKQTGTQNYLSVFAPVPKRLPELETDEQKQSVYTKEEFQGLTAFSKNAPDPQEHPKHEAFDPDAIRIGGKEPLTDEEFAAVAIAGAMSAEVQLKAYRVSHQYDPTVEQAIQNAGFPEDKVPLILTANNISTFATTDLFDYKGRATEGKHFATVSEPGRQLAAEAFRDYQAGNKEKLAKMIAVGVNTASRVFVCFDAIRFGYNSFGTLIPAKQLLGLMDKDPELKALALRQGMEPKHHESLKGLVKLNDMESEARQATYELAKARSEHRELSAEEKAGIAKKLIAHKLANRQLSAHGRSVRNGTDGHSGVWQQKISPVPQPPGVPEEQWPVPEPGKVYQNAYESMRSGIQMAFAEPAGVTLELAKPGGQEKLEQIAEQIVRQENVDKMSTNDLYEQLGVNSYSTKFKLAESAERAMQTLGVAAPAQPARMQKPVYTQTAPQTEQGQMLGIQA